MDIVVTKPNDLTPTERSFAHYLVADPKMDHIEAYLKVSPDISRKSATATANRLLKKAEVKELVAHLMEERQKRLQMDEDWVMNRLRDIHDRCTQAVPVWEGLRYKTDPETHETIEQEPSYYKFDAAGALKSLELMGRHMKMFSDKVDGSNLSVDVAINLGGDKPVIEGTYKRVANS